MNSSLLISKTYNFGFSNQYFFKSYLNYCKEEVKNQTSAYKR